MFLRIVLPGSAIRTLCHKNYLVTEILTLWVFGFPPFGVTRRVAVQIPFLVARRDSRTVLQIADDDLATVMEIFAFDGIVMPALVAKHPREMVRPDRVVHNLGAVVVDGVATGATVGAGGGVVVVVELVDVVATGSH